MIIIDSNESPEYYRLLNQSVPVDTQRINQKPNSTDILPDFMIYSGGKAVGVNHKQIGEFIGNIDGWDEQVQREVEFGDIDYMVIYIDGVVTVEPDGSCYTWNLGKNVWIPGHHYKVDYSRVSSVLTRCWEMGMPVIRTSTWQEGCYELVQLHNRLEKGAAHKTFQRFVKRDFGVNRRQDGESDEDWQRRKNFIEVLMTYKGAGVGEEMAVALSMYFTNMMALINWLCEDSIAELTIESGRKIGPAVDKKLRAVLGVSE